MTSGKKEQEKARLHPRNKNRERYDLKALVRTLPELKKHIINNKFGTTSIDFANPLSVKLLNKALLNHYYGIKHWDFPDENLCPPILGRADYMHYIADLLSESKVGEIPKGDKITCLDVGVGASCIYPIIGVTEYGWSFIGADINPKSLKSAQENINNNPSTKGKVEFRLQKNPKDIFRGIIGKEDKIDITICNPPFHSSREVAKQGARRKVGNLSGKKVNNPELNFAGISDELICEGGEYNFIQTMIRESKQFSKNCFWFSTLVSKQANLKGIYKLLEQTEAKQVRTIPMGTGNKVSRVVAWTFSSKDDFGNSL